MMLKAGVLTYSLNPAREKEKPIKNPTTTLRKLKEDERPSRRLEKYKKETAKDSQRQLP